MRLEYGADARGRDARVIDLLGDFFKVWTDLDEIRRNVNFHKLIVMARKVEEMQRAELFVDDGSGARVGRFDRESGVIDELRFRLRFYVVSEECVGAVAIRQKINRVADPHGVESFQSSCGSFTTLESARSAIQIRGDVPPR